MSKAITTTISDEMHALAKEKKISWHDALSRGIRAIADGDRTNAEIEILKEGNRKLHTKLTELATELSLIRENARQT